MFIKRFWQYQKERFPIIQYFIFILLFYLSFYLYAGFLNGKPPVNIALMAKGFLTVFLVFFELRLFDEIKDYETDLKYQPERPVQRGLISLREVRIMIPISIAVMFLINLFSFLSNILFFAVLQAFILIMSKEFFFGEVLKKNRIAYASLHMLSMVFIAAYVINHSFGAGNWTFPAYMMLLLAYISGFIIEVGRKIEAPENERRGVDNYSKLLGPEKAALLLLALSASSSAVAYLLTDGYWKVYSLISFIPSLVTFFAVIVFIRKKSPRNAKNLNASSSLQVMGLFLILIVFSIIK